VPLEAVVPASSANLGPGFDCLGLAVGVHLRVVATPADRDAFVDEDGRLDPGPDDLIHRGFRRAFERAGATAPPVHLSIRNAIPLARGLGSSSAALVAGALLGDAANGGALGRDGVFALAADLEGHPDNVAPAVYGGLVLAAEDAGGWTRRTLPWPAAWRIAFGVPAFEVPTDAARDVLSPVVTRAEAVGTAARLAFWPVAVWTEDPELLRVASRDAIHEPQRRALVPGLDAARDAALDAGAYAAFLSGAGPTLAVVTSDAAAPAVHAVLADYAGPEGTVLTPDVGTAARVTGRFDGAPPTP
jgi:homoserine kinase